MSRRASLSPALAAFALALAVAGCRGPAPAVIREELRPPDVAGAPYRALIAIANRGRGEGQIEVTARLHARGSTAAQASGEFHLGPSESLDVTLDLRPMAPAPYELAVEVHYPPP